MIDNRDDNSGEDGRQYNTDPIIQSRDESGSQAENILPVEAVLRTKRAMPLSETALLPGQFIGSRNNNQNAWSGNYVLKSALHYKWTIIVTFFVIAVPLLAVIWTQIVPKYQARAEIRIRPIIPYLVFRTDDNGMIPLYNSFLNTQVSIIRSLTVLQRVLDQKEIQETQWYNAPQQSFMSKLRGNKMTAMERLRDDLSVRPRSQTEIIDISFVYVDSQDAKLIINTVLDEYLKYVREMSDENENTLYQQLVDEYKKLENKISGQEKVVEDLLNSLGTSAPQELVASKRIAIEQLQDRLSEIQQNLAILEKKEGLRKQDQTYDGNDASTAAAEQPQYYEDAEWRKLDIDIRTIQHQINTSLFTDKNPEMIKLREHLKYAEELRQLRETQLDDRQENMPKNITAIAGISGQNLEEQLKSIKDQNDLLSKNLKERQEEFDKVFKSAQLLEKETNNLAHTRDLFNAVRQRLDQKNMERNVPGSIEVLARAFSPSRYYNDRRLVFSAMVLCLAFGIGGIIAFIRASINQVIFTAKDMLLPIKVPNLGSVPLIHLKNPLGKSLGEEIERNQILLFESIRVIRTKLLLQLNTQDSSVVLISSSAAGTGKSSFTRMLGKCMAKTGKNTLIIDVDFYKTTLSKRFGLFEKPGIINFLNSKSLDFTSIFQTETPNLSIMPAGRQVREGVFFEGIDNGFFRSYIDELRKQYSVIILDGPPVLPRADAAIMSNHVDGTIMVERELVSRRENLVNSIERINSSGGNIWGVVYVGSSGYEKYEYGYGY